MTTLNKGLSPAETKQANDAWLDLAQSSNSERQEKAASAIDDYTRTEMKEGGIWRTIFPPQPITAGDLDNQLTTESFVKIIEREPESPGAQPIGFDTLPDNWYLRVDKWPCYFTRMTTAKATKDVQVLATTRMDIRTIVSDKMVKDLLAAEDVGFIQSVNLALVGPNQVVPTSGTVQYPVFGSTMADRNAWAQSMKVMPSTPSSLMPQCALVNCISIFDIAAMSRNEIGGDMAQDIMRDGWTMENWLGLKWCVTLKKGLVPNGTIYQFADPDFIGKSFVMQEPTMFMKRERMTIEYSMMETIGAGIGWTSGLTRIDFDTP